MGRSAGRCTPTRGGDDDSSSSSRLARRGVPEAQPLGVPGRGRCWSWACCPSPRCPPPRFRRRLRRPSHHNKPENELPNTWSPTASPMSVARTGQTATLLPDGDVLVAGGGTKTADLYDPSTGTFTATGSMSVARTNAAATLLPNGKVLVAGGIDSRGQQVANADLYDPTTGMFTPTGPCTRLDRDRRRHCSMMARCSSPVAAATTTDPATPAASWTT